MNATAASQQPQLQQIADRHDDQVAASSTTDSVHEALFLFAVAGAGIVLNAIVLACIFFCRHLRRMTSAFVFHGTVLDVIKCIFCIPFATSLLNDLEPDFCGVLGGSYVIMVTASGFNIVASICCEAYTFSEHNVGGDGRGSLCCVMFGITMVYVGSIIIHLGPTIIGGVFKFNEAIGNCIFKYGTVQSYVVHAMWIVIMTLSMVGAIYYLVFFYRHVQANSTHRLASLVRASIAVSRGNTDSQDIRKIIRESLSRTRVLILITALYVICWYPLFILTLLDPGFLQPPRVYRLLTFVAWSNGALNPLVMLLFDRNLSVLKRRIVCCRSITRCLRCWGDDDDDDDDDEMTDTPLMVQAGPSGRTGTLSRGSSRRGSLPRGLASAAVYQRVGCRLCQEGQSHPGTNCNGEAGKTGPMKRDSSMCELHTFSVM
ncbi:hypothetical protein CAPTEDRAFT_208991 [Capitella teleta]|uniref:G-protein coupled receptors family 1 profile domain-containing protein n=1 Tax=Capitella teleta TaxID=283909 RepID=R7TXV4_CAPTE|nr:hypothetical protein CAPTEDRAFT_208991 [Capitella teleta]|eukprot:ELT98569.1 hypothetical protein CAPTEDRAFT_208991 [Capitella teleta]